MGYTYTWKVCLVIPLESLVHITCTSSIWQGTKGVKISIIQNNWELLYHKCNFKIELDAYLEEELYDLITYCVQNSNASDYSIKENRIKEIGQELFADGGVDALENMYFSIEHRVREEISEDAKPYRSLWNGISNEWNY